MTRRLRRRGRPGAGALLLGAAGACVLFQPPVQPDPELLGCYHLDSDLPASYTDSLGYELPRVLRLDVTGHGQWTVVPTDPEWHPEWTVYDRLPSGRVRQAMGTGATSPLQWDSVGRIPGDSVDVVFPGMFGTLTLRVGREEGSRAEGDDRSMGGRAEWVGASHELFLNEGVRVRASPASCADLQLELRRR